jgi:hypothetical protein
MPGAAGVARHFTAYRCHHVGWVASRPHVLSLICGNVADVTGARNGVA